MRDSPSLVSQTHRHFVTKLESLHLFENIVSVDPHSLSSLELTHLFKDVVREAKEKKSPFVTVTTSELSAEQITKLQLCHTIEDFANVFVTCLDIRHDPLRNEEELCSDGGESLVNLDRAKAAAERVTQYQDAIKTILLKRVDLQVLIRAVKLRAI